MFETIEIKDVKNEIGELMKALRKQRKLSQAELAGLLSVSRTTIQNLELGRNFTVDTLLKVVKELDLLETLHREIVQSKAQVTQTKSLY
ncbi:MAG: helix-turn-helix transcriptional regulator [Flavobacteriales bacterium]|nr:helix-turn-helix transcriptional regulator [Flavobacteriales bacterium]